MNNAGRVVPRPAQAGGAPNHHGDVEGNTAVRGEQQASGARKVHAAPLRTCPQNSGSSPHFDGRSTGPTNKTGGDLDGSVVVVEQHEGSIPPPRPAGGP